MHSLRRLLWNLFWTGIPAMSDKKDYSKQRLSDFLAARLRAKGHEETHTPKSRRDSVKAAANPAEKRTPPSTGS
jgi:hypothetical protein